MYYKKLPRVIVIGLDGATWDLLEPWVREEKLPTFKKLMREGAWGKLRSTIPPITFPAWGSIFTGKNPGKLGVFAFVNVDCENRSLNINTPSSFKDEPLWKILNKYGYKTCMIGIPTSRVQSVDGMMVGGPFSEGNEVYPPNFKSFLEKMNYELYPMDLAKVFIEASKTKSPKDVIEKTIASRFRLAECIVDMEKPDFLAFIIFVIDNIQHFYWGEPLVYETWSLIDRELDRFLSNFEDSIVILVSDHGFMKLSKTFYISGFLEEKGLIAYKKPFLPPKINTGTLVTLARKTGLDKILLRLFSKKRLRFMLSIFPSKEGRLGAMGLKHIIDWEKTKCVPLTSAIYLNCSEKEKEKLKKYLRTKLKELRGIVKDVHFREEIYSGKYLEEAPDLVIEPEEGVRILENPFAKEMITTGNTTGWKGQHASDGIFLIYGPEIEKNTTEATLYDIAPTILSIYGIPPSPDMDGRVLNEIIGDGDLEKKQEAEKLRIKRSIRELRDRL